MRMIFQKMGKVMNLILGLVLWISGMGILTLAQTETFSIAGLTSNLRFQEWQADRNSFVFQDPSSDPEIWFQVDVNTQQTTQSLAYPINPPLSDAERQIFQTSDVIRASPNGDILLYVARADDAVTLAEGDAEQYFYMLANRNAQQIITLALRAPSEISLGDLTNLIWSTDNSSLAIGTLTEAGTLRIAYLSFPDASHLETAISYTFNENIEGRKFYTSDPFLNRLFDISDSGERVLLSAQEDDVDLGVYNERTFFILWYPMTPVANKILDIPAVDPRLASASFSPESNDVLYLWVFDELGSISGSLYSYNFILGELHFLVNLAPLYNPIFSPDGRWLSYSTDNELVFLRLEGIGAGE